MCSLMNSDSQNHASPFPLQCVGIVRLQFSLCPTNVQKTCSAVFQLLRSTSHTVCLGFLSVPASRLLYVEEFWRRQDVPMLNVLKMRSAQLIDAVRTNGWSSALKQVAFFRRAAIVVEKDLSEVVERPEQLANLKLKVLEIDGDMLSSGAYHFAVPNRHLKALHYLQKHKYGGFALARDNVIVGDQWYWVSETTNDPSSLQVDLRLFGFKTWQASHVYTFDIFVAPGERKQGVSAAFQNNGMFSLRSKGYTKAYGYYFADNIPAFWCTRITNKWKELRTVKISRLLMFTWVDQARKQGGRESVRPASLKNAS